MRELIEDIELKRLLKEGTNREILVAVLKEVAEIAAKVDEFDSGAIYGVMDDFKKDLVELINKK